MRLVSEAHHVAVQSLVSLFLFRRLRKRRGEDYRCPVGHPVVGGDAIAELLRIGEPQGFPTTHVENVDMIAFT
ncbi:MAG: hypothetical protein V3U13_07955 [Gemmatimonadota bacterium]